MRLKFKKLSEDAVLPSKAKAGDAGMDLTATTDGKMGFPDETTKELFYYVEYGTGLAVEIPEGHVGLLFPRSSISKTGLILANGVGVIDSGYRGEIKLRFKVDAGIVTESTDEHPVAAYKKGDKIGQLIVVPYPSFEPEFADELADSDRGSNGFGSTGN